MLKKMRWRFVGSAMAAFFAVMAVLIAGINFWNYSITIDRADHFLHRLAEEETDRKGDDFPAENASRMGRKPEEKALPVFFPAAPDSAETKDALRYFSVKLDGTGAVEEIQTQFSQAVSQQGAEEYALKAYASGKQKGFLDAYRYLVKQSEDSVQIVFLNVTKEVQFIRTLFLISGLVGIVSLTIVLILVFLFSGYAMKPYIKNLELQKRFITDASHELKTPLTSISTSADILAMEDEANEWICNIRKQTVRLSKLIGDLITLSRLDEENPFPNQSEFSFSDMVWETIEPFVSIAKAREKQFTYQIEDGLFMKGDQGSLQQMVSLLLDNAMKYSDDNGIVRLSLGRRHGKIMLEVFNTCSTASKKEADKLFERFYRPDQSRSKEAGGTGIGLSIAKAAVEAHKGKISVSCREKESICFKVIF